MNLRLIAACAFAASASAPAYSENAKPGAKVNCTAMAATCRANATTMVGSLAPAASVPSNQKQNPAAVAAAAAQAAQQKAAAEQTYFQNCMAELNCAGRQ